MKNSLGFICRAILIILLALSLTACSSGSDGENVSVGSDSGNSNGITDDHGNSIPFSTPISLNDNVNGNIETGGDVDYFSFRATNGKTYTIETTIGTLDDTVISLYDENSYQIVSDDDSGVGGSSKITWTCQLSEQIISGTYYVKVEAYDDYDIGTYTLRVQEESGDSGDGDGGGDDGGSNGDGDDDGDGGLDLSQIGSSWTTDMSTAIMADTDGNVMVVQSDSVVWTSPNGESFVVYYGSNWLPTRVVGGEYVIVYENWTTNTVDIAIVSPDGIYTIYRGVAVEPNLISLISERSLSSRAVTTHLSLDFSAIDLATALNRGGQLVSAALCGVAIGSAITSAGVTIPAVIAACSSTALTIASELTSGDNASVEGTGDTLTIISSVTCDNPLSCAGAFADLAGTILEDADSTQNNLSTLITDAESKLSDTSDIDPPTTPTGLTANAVSSSEINLSWNASYDNVGILGYRIYRDGIWGWSISGNSTSDIDIGLNPDTQYCYTVSAIDAAVNASDQSNQACATTLSNGGDTYPDHVINTVTVGDLDFPCAIAITPDSRHVYVPNDDDGTVSVIDSSSDTVVKTISVGSDAEWLTISPDGSYVYVPTSKSISVIATSTNTIVRTISVPTDWYLGPITITPDGKYLYVAETGAYKLYVISASTGDTVEIITLDSYSYSIAMDPSGQNVYVSQNFDDEVLVIDTGTKQIVKSISVLSPCGMAVSPNGDHLYVGSETAEKVSVISTASYSVIQEVSVDQGSRSVAITPDGAYLYVAIAFFDKISIIDLSTSDVIADVNVGSLPEGIAVTPNGKRVYVANINDNTVSVLSD